MRNLFSANLCFWSTRTLRAGVTLCYSIKNPQYSEMAGSDVLKTLLYTINTLLQQEKYKAALAVLKGFRNGAVWVVFVPRKSLLVYILHTLSLALFNSLIRCLCNPRWLWCRLIIQSTSPPPSWLVQPLLIQWTGKWGTGHCNWSSFISDWMRQCVATLSLLCSKWPTAGMHFTTQPTTPLCTVLQPVGYF